jgi:hypothetical protein
MSRRSAVLLKTTVRMLVIASFFLLTTMPPLATVDAASASLKSSNTNNSKYNSMPFSSSPEEPNPYKATQEQPSSSQQEERGLFTKLYNYFVDFSWTKFQTDMSATIRTAVTRCHVFLNDNNGSGMMVLPTITTTDYVTIFMDHDFTIFIMDQWQETWNDMMMVLPTTTDDWIILMNQWQETLEQGYYRLVQTTMTTMAAIHRAVSAVVQEVVQTKTATMAVIDRTVTSVAQEASRLLLQEQRLDPPQVQPSPSPLPQDARSNPKVKDNITKKPIMKTTKKIDPATHKKQHAASSTAATNDDVRTDNGAKQTKDAPTKKDAVPAKKDVPTKKEAPATDDDDSAAAKAARLLLAQQQKVHVRQILDAVQRGGKDVHYRVLGLHSSPATATPKQIKKAFYKRSLQVHPDKNPVPGAIEAMRAVNAAYDTLTGVKEPKPARDDERTGDEKRTEEEELAEAILFAFAAALFALLVGFVLYELAIVAFLFIDKVIESFFMWWCCAPRRKGRKVPKMADRPRILRRRRNGEGPTNTNDLLADVKARRAARRLRANAVSTTTRDTMPPRRRHHQRDGSGRSSLEFARDGRARDKRS